MNNKSPNMVTILVSVLAFLGVSYVAYSFIIAPYRLNAFRIAAMTSENDKKQDDYMRFLGDQKRLGDKWNQFSLPKNVDVAVADYGGKLRPLLSKAGLTVDDFKPTQPQEARTNAGQKKTPQHQILTFSIRAHGTLKALTKATEQLRQVPVMHRVKTVVVDRADPKDKTGKLNVQMTIEAMIIAGTDNQQMSWRPSAAKLELLKGTTLSERNLADLPLRDPFLGKVPLPPEKKKEAPPVEREYTGPDQREFVRIDTILPNVQEASLFDRSRNATIRLRSKAKSGYDVFRITDEDRGKTVVKAKVLRIDARDVFFQVGHEVFAMHIGETLAEAMKKPMDHEEVEALELTALIDPEFAKETAGTGKFTGTGSSSKNSSKRGGTKGSSSR